MNPILFGYIKETLFFSTIFIVVFLYGCGGGGGGTTPPSTPMLKETIAYDGTTGQLPDPTLFAQSGNLTSQPTAGLGLVIMGTDDVGSLMYTHNSVFLSAAPAQAEFKNLATVVCRLKLPQFNGTGVGSRGVVGARVVLQDGGVRAELGFGVNAMTGVREITVLDIAEVGNCGQSKRSLNS